MSTSEQSERIPAPQKGAQFRWAKLKWLWVTLAVLPAVSALGILFFVMRFGFSHSESRCPFHERSRQRAGADVVIEEARRCLPEVVEHRWRLVGQGGALELGRYPRESGAAPYPWILSSESGRAVVRVTVGNRGDIVFREPETR